MAYTGGRIGEHPRQYVVQPLQGRGRGRHLICTPFFSYEFQGGGAVPALSLIHILEPKPGACVPVLVWKIKPSDERALDLYEGYPHLYRKENLSVTLDGGERDIMAYVMTGEREYGVPARSYYETIARGYADAGFDTGVLNEAVQESVRRMLNEVAPEEELNGTWQMTL